MQTALVILLCLAGAPVAKPTQAALRKAFEANRHRLVEVVGPRRSGAGVIVGATGEVVTSVDFVGLYEAKVRFDGRELGAKVLLANARLKVAVLAIDAAGEFPAAPVELADSLQRGSWLVGIGRRRGGEPFPAVGRVRRLPTERRPFLETDLPLPPGSPVFDAKGKLVAITVRRSGRASSRALPLTAVKLELGGGPRP